jgi:tetratricopeptide (TPR) repeat protein
VRYLLETQGPGALKLVYPHADFEDVYKRPLDALVQEWEAHIAKLATTVQDNHVAADRYFTPSIFTRTCAHEIARLQQLAEQSPPMRAVALRREVVEHLGGAAQARAALAEAKLAAGDLSGFVSDADALLASKNLSFAAQAHLEELASFALWQAGRQQEAQERAQRVLDLNVGDGPSRLAWVRLWAMSQDTEAQSALMAYTSGSLSPVAACVYLARATAANPDAPTYPYLLGRQLFAAQAWAEAVAPLNQAVHHPFALISEEASRMLATSLSELGRSTEAQAVWQRLATTSQRSGIVAQAKDGLARLDWAQAHAAAPNPDATH